MLTAHSLGNQSWRMLSRPIDVYWAGWRSTTVDLQQAGWELSAEQDVRMCAMRVAMQHRESRCVAISSYINDFQYSAYARDYDCKPPPICIQYFGARDMKFVTTGDVRSWNMQPIDAAPQFLTTEIKTIEDLKWFSVPLVRTEEIIVEPETVSMLMDRIREMQAPEQARIRHKQRLAERREGMQMDAHPRQNFHAQIVSLAA